MSSDRVTQTEALKLVDLLRPVADSYRHRHGIAKMNPHVLLDTLHRFISTHPDPTPESAVCPTCHGESKRQACVCWCHQKHSEECNPWKCSQYRPDNKTTLQVECPTCHSTGLEA